MRAANWWLGAVLTAAGLAGAAPPPQTLKVEWGQVQRVSKTAASLQVVVNPMLRRGSPMHDATFEALRNLGADYVRYVPWLPYPKLAVAELQPGAWDFSLIDPMTLDFLRACEGHSTVLNFSTIPAWLFPTEQPVTYPDDPDQPVWNYTQGQQLRENGLRELGDYYARLVSWYTEGGFTDEAGRRHESGHHFALPYWEVFNEVESEHQTNPKDYAERYDAVVEAIRAVSPKTKFVGLALASPSTHPEMFEYFLDHRNHRPGIPLDMISYHFYASPTREQTAEHWQYTFFDQADRFLTTVRFVEAIRQRLSPETGTMLNEIGIILPGDPGQPGEPEPVIPEAYWNAAGALYGYVFTETARMGIDVVNESQLVGYPTQFPSVTMIDWKTGAPNARYWVLKLIHDQFGPGDKLVRTHLAGRDVEAQGFDTPRGRRLLLVNKRNRDVEVPLEAEVADATLAVVDGNGPARVAPFSGRAIALKPFAVAVLSLR